MVRTRSLVVDVDDEGTPIFSILVRSTPRTGFEKTFSWLYIYLGMCTRSWPNFSLRRLTRQPARTLDHWLKAWPIPIRIVAHTVKLLISLNLEQTKELPQVSSSLPPSTTLSEVRLYMAIDLVLRRKSKREKSIEHLSSRFKLSPRLWDNKDMFAVSNQ